MAETMNNKPSLQLRGISNGNGTMADKSPSPSPKLLISHGKPNFTIPRSPKVQDNEQALSPQPSVNNNYNAFKSANSNINKSNYNNNIVVGTKFNGVFKPSTNLGNWASKESGDENEAAKVVLRRPKLAEQPAVTEGEDANVPEFIRRQRRIQERLAKENVLDFENRRSGYFTHVMISPDSPNRTSFAETMASPAIVPALEMPIKIQEEDAQAEQQLNEDQVEPVAQLTAEPISNGNGHEDDVVPEDVAQAIEEVNKAVAGEDDEKQSETEPKIVPEPEAQVELTTEPKAELLVEPEPQKELQAVAVTSAPVSPTSAPAPVEAKVEVITPVVPVSPTTEAEPIKENGHAHEADAITISHTNGHTDVPSIPAPDPSGSLGVNYEPKTVVSFAQELGGGSNNYPDTVKVVKEGSEPPTPADAELAEMTKLKFDIKNDEQNEVQVTPVLRAE